MKKRLIPLLFAFAIILSLPFVSPRAYAAEEAYAGKVVTSQTRLNVRSAPSTRSQILGGLPKGTVVALIEKTGEWWKVEYSSGRYGYCHEDYIETVSAQRATVSADGSRLNIRTGPGTGYRILSKFTDGSSVTVLSSQNGWAKVLYGGKNMGYVAEEFLTYPTTGPQAVKLSVPRMYQTDSRWASIRLGNSSYTIGTAGCTTTAMSMVESALRGYTVTPAMLVKEVRYSSSGNLYWPSNYTPYTGKDYLSVVHDQLKDGRPVMIGGFTPGGAQHWVVITGFTGGELTAENFLINDPGSSSRTTLAQFQAKYSVFYKIMLRG